MIFQAVLDVLMRNAPFSFFYSIDEFMVKHDVKTILDVGCGNGDLMGDINNGRKLIVDGVDLFDPYLKAAKKTGLYRKLYKHDFQTFQPKEKYDLVFASHVIEHISKKDGIRLLKVMRVWSKKLVIVMTPYGFCEQHEYDENPLQEHHSGWYPSDFKRVGYRSTVKGLSSYFVKDKGNFWEETFRYKLFKKIISPIFPISQPYLLCYYVH